MLYSRAVSELLNKLFDYSDLGNIVFIFVAGEHGIHTTFAVSVKKN